MTFRVALVAAALAGAAAAAGAQTPATPADPPVTSPRPAAPAAPDASTLLFSGAVGIVIHPIKPDKVAEFEGVIRRLRDGLRASADPVRRQQAAGLRIFKAAEPGPAGAVLYLLIADPVVKEADYTVSHLLAEMFPGEVQQLWMTLRETYAGGLHRLSLEELTDAPAAPVPTPAAPPAR
jgi:hypothetical protein